jgi:hypothetical protein
MTNGAREWAFVLDAPLRDGPCAQITPERWHQVHGLLDQGVDLLECAHRLQLALNTVQYYARADQPERMLRVPRYRASLVAPYRAYLRKRRATAAWPGWSPSASLRSGRGGEVRQEVVVFGPEITTDAGPEHRAAV